MYHLHGEKTFYVGSLHRLFVLNYLSGCKYHLQGPPPVETQEGNGNDPQTSQAAINFGLELSLFIYSFMQNLIQ